MTEGRVLQIGQSKKKELEPVFTYIVLLNNGKTLSQQATTWFENTGDEGEGIAYNFFMHKQRVLTLEYTEVRAVFNEQHCDVVSAIEALTYVEPKPKRKKKVAV